MTLPQQELRNRTKAFAIRILKLCRTLPRTHDAKVLSDQLIRSGTSVAANHRAACRARSRQEFVAKIGLVVEESDEAQFWLELLCESGLVQQEKLSDLRKEAGELTAIFTASYHTAKGKRPE